MKFYISSFFSTTFYLTDVVTHRRFYIHYVLYICTRFYTNLSLGPKDTDYVEATIVYIYTYIQFILYGQVIVYGILFHIYIIIMGIIVVCI